MAITRQVILYIAMRLYGYIAKQNDDLSFLSFVEKKGEDIFIDGGAEIVNELLKEKLIDEFYI